MHRRRKVYNIGGGGKQGLEYWGGGGGGKVWNIGGGWRGEFPAGTWRRTDVDATQRRRIDVMCPLGFFINQCQIITFLILKTGNIENLRIELKGIVLPVPI